MSISPDNVIYKNKEQLNSANNINDLNVSVSNNYTSCTTLNNRSSLVSAKMSKFDKIKYENTKIEQIKELLNNSYNNFKKIKFNNEIYSLGDDVLILDSSNEYLVAKINKIITFQGISTYSYWPTIEVQWYYRKCDIIKDAKYISKFKEECISDYELFESCHTDIICIESVIGRCYVLKFDEYEKLEEVNSNIYYTRAYYNPVKKSLNPPFDKWNKICVCNLPLNPDCIYVKCDECNIWCHPNCVGINDSKINDIENFRCPKCNNDNN